MLRGDAYFTPDGVIQNGNQSNHACQENDIKTGQDCVGLERWQMKKKVIGMVSTAPPMITIQRALGIPLSTALMRILLAFTMSENADNASLKAAG